MPRGQSGATPSPSGKSRLNLFRPGIQRRACAGGLHHDSSILQGLFPVPGAPPRPEKAPSSLCPGARRLQLHGGPSLLALGGKAAGTEARACRGCEDWLGRKKRWTRPGVGGVVRAVEQTAQSRGCTGRPARKPMARRAWSAEIIAGREGRAEAFQPWQSSL